jgi:hypothetical protein
LGVCRRLVSCDFESSTIIDALSRRPPQKNDAQRDAGYVPAINLMMARFNKWAQPVFAHPEARSSCKPWGRSAGERRLT